MIKNMLSRALTAFLVWGAVVSLSASASLGSTRPNIVFIFSDDHATQAIGAYGERLSKLKMGDSAPKFSSSGENPKPGQFTLARHRIERLLAITSSVDGAESSPVAKASPSIVADAPISITDLRTGGVSQRLRGEEAAPRVSWRYAASSKISKASRGFQRVA